MIVVFVKNDPKIKTLIWRHYMYTEIDAKQILLIVKKFSEFF